MLIERYQITGSTYRKGTVFTATGYDQEMDAYVIGSRMVPRGVVVMATPELIEAAKRERAAEEAKDEARRLKYKEARRVQELINSAPASPYAENPLFGMF
ncbi:hypothetical protein NKH72_22095 [Mesorhizobium sp. M0955]|uniref:hypothetical protein n=1 Tax=Mesorhizobium sp. M0955 TaxID=2957033 RepID=UPI0033391D77